MTRRLNISSGAKWEDAVSYSRAVRVGNLVEVAGTAAAEGDQIIGDTPYEQSKFILSKIEKALHKAGAALNDVVRTRIYVTDISRWQEVGKAHGEYFAKIKPVTTMIEVKALIHPDLLVEIEASAIIES